MKGKTSKKRFSYKIKKWFCLVTSLFLFCFCLVYSWNDETDLAELKGIWNKRCMDSADQDGWLFLWCTKGGEEGEMLPTSLRCTTSLPLQLMASFFNKEPKKIHSISVPLGGGWRRWSDRWTNRDPEPVPVLHSVHNKGANRQLGVLKWLLLLFDWLIGMCFCFEVLVNEPQMCA